MGSFLAVAWFFGAAWAETGTGQEQDIHGTEARPPWDRDITSTGQEADIHGAGTRYPWDPSRAFMGQEEDP